MGGKFDATWKGPYTIAEVVGKGRYRLKRGDGKDLKKLYNGILLKEYLEPSEPSPSKPPGLSQTKPSPDKPNPEEKPSPDNKSNSDGEIGGPPPKKRKVHKGWCSVTDARTGSMFIVFLYLGRPWKLLV